MSISRESRGRKVAHSLLQIVLDLRINRSCFRTGNFHILSGLIRFCIERNRTESLHQVIIIPTTEEFSFCRQSSSCSLVHRNRRDILDCAIGYIDSLIAIVPYTIHARSQLHGVLLTLQFARILVQDLLSFVSVDKISGQDVVRSRKRDMIRTSKIGISAHHTITIQTVHVCFCLCLGLIVSYISQRGLWLLV